MKGFRNFISLLIVIVLTIMGIYTVCIFNASNFLTEKNLTKTVKKVNLVEVLSEDTKTINGNASLSTMDQIYDMANNVSISKEHVDAVINSDAMKEFAGDYLTNVATYITTGEEKNISGTELTEIVRNNIDTISNETGINLNDSMKQNVVNGVERYANEIVTLIPSPKVVTESLDDNQLKAIQNLFHNDVKSKLLWGLGGLTLLLILVQFSWWKWLSWHSISIAITGALSCILGLIATPMIDGLLLDHNEVVLLNLLHHFTDALSKNFYIIGGILLLIAFIQISIYVNVRHHLKQKEVNRAKESLKEQSEELK